MTTQRSEILSLGLEDAGEYAHSFRSALSAVGIEVEIPALGITGTSPFDELSSVIRKAIEQGLVTAQPYDESPSRVKDITAAIGGTAAPYSEKPVIVTSWLD